MRWVWYGRGQHWTKYSFFVQVAVDMDFDKEMLKLHQRVNHNEVIVGWYVTHRNWGGGGLGWSLASG